MNLRSLATRLDDRVRGTVQTDYPLSGLTTYRVGGPALVYLEPADLHDLEALGEVLQGEDVPVLVLGRGSNLVISDSGFPGIVIRLGMSFSWIRADGPDGMVAGSATPLPMLANWAARRGLAGVEFAIAIPGSVGGGIFMNAGAHGGEMADVLRSVTVYDLGSNGLKQLEAAELGLVYRHSELTERQVVLEASFELERDEEATVRSRMDGYRKHRAETQPGALQNAGSTFKNPDGDSAGRLVEAAGLKGHRIGGVSVSELHANFFIAEEGSTSQQVFDLVHDVRRLVAERMGVELQPEVRFVGAFEGGDA
jgi:UDP-N-acetylmuramate dehydrogenase